MQARRHTSNGRQNGWKQIAGSFSRCHTNYHCYFSPLVSRRSRFLFLILCRISSFYDNLSKQQRTSTMQCKLLTELCDIK